MIRLQRTIRVSTFQAEATVAVGRDRPEFLAVARLAADLGHPIGGRDVTRELLGKLPESVGWRVIDRCIGLGLLVRDGHRGPAALSDSGRQMLEQGAVLVPEEGSWCFYIVDDPLVPGSVVHVERIDTEDAKAERKHLKERGRGNLPGSGNRLPRRLVESKDTLLQSVASGQAFELRDLSERGENGNSSGMLLVLSWEVGQDPAVRLEGRLDSEQRGAGRRIDHTLGSVPALRAWSYDTLWADLVSRATGASDEELLAWAERIGAHVLPTQMSQWPDAARRTFLADLDIPSGSIHGLGSYEASKLAGVSLVPRTDDDASIWAEWLQWDSIDRYLTPQGLAEMSQRVLDRFPLHRPWLPDPEDLLERARREPRTPRSRFLLAPADLGLWS